MPAQYFENERFSDRDFSGGSFQGLTLVDCDFIGCTFENCLVSHCVFTECRFTGCRITDPKLEYSQVKFLTAEGCSLTGVNWGLLLPSGGFGEPIDRLTDCRLKYNFFTEMDLRKFQFTGSAFDGCMFADCNLMESDFSNCPLGGTEFFRCNLTGADFRASTGYKVDVPSCTMQRARFTLPEAAGLLYSLGIRLE